MLIRHPVYTLGIRIYNYTQYTLKFPEKLVLNIAFLYHYNLIISFFKLITPIAVEIRKNSF